MLYPYLTHGKDFSSNLEMRGDLNFAVRSLRLVRGEKILYEGWPRNRELYQQRTLIKPSHRIQCITYSCGNDNLLRSALCSALVYESMKGESLNGLVPKV